MDFDIDGGHKKVPLQHFTFSPDIKNFWIKQDSFHGFTRTKVIGNVIVHSCDKASNISAHFNIEATDDELRSQVSIIPKEDGIQFKLNPFSLAKQTVNATIWIVIPKASDYELEDLRISTVQLNVWLKDSLTTKINSTYVSSVDGDINALGKSTDGKGLNVNNLKAKTVSSDISGEFPLHHALALETTSGKIDAAVNSADLEEETAWLKTKSVSGSTNIKFISNLHPRPLYSSHHSVSGDLSVEYPEDWQGGLKIETTSGHIDVEGKGTEIVKKEKDIVGKFWKVIKGDGKSKGFLGTVSGKIRILIGEVEDEEE